jgi:hypothetical protein
MVPWLGLLMMVCILTFLSKISSEYASVDENPNTLFAFVTYLYNESDILPYWLEYHTKLAGIRNVAVIDNQSPNKTQLILQEWEKKGLKVINNTEDYLLKGNTTYKTFKRYFPSVYFAVPLDADEFIVALDRSGRPVFSKSAVVKAFNETLQSSLTCFNYFSAFKDCNYYGNETIENDRHFYTISHPKKRFFKLSKLHGLDHGNHRGYYCHHWNYTKRFGMLHFHNRNLQVKLQRALKDLESFQYVNNSLDHFQNLTKTEQNNSVAVLKELAASNHQGNHKARELLHYFSKGTDGLRENCPTGANETLVLPKVKRMIELL